MATEATTRLLDLPVPGIDAIESGPRKVSWHPGAINPALRTSRYLSPLRYPGAKSLLYPVLGGIFEGAIERAGMSFDLLVEPFAGGASTSLRLVAEGKVERVLLADADPVVAAFWQVAAADTDYIIDRMHDEYARYVDVGGAAALARWDHWKHWTPTPGDSNASVRRDRAMRCLFLNRTTFSGILHGRAGPLGGRAQTSKHTIGCRFNPDDLAERLRFIEHLYRSNRLVDVWRADWRTTLDTIASRYKLLLPDNVVAYLDPPYLTKSERLYPEAAGAFPHAELAAYLRSEARFRWVLSYDNDPALFEPPLYAARRMKSDPSTGVSAWFINSMIAPHNYSASAKSGRGARSEAILTSLPKRALPHRTGQKAPGGISQRCPEFDGKQHFQLLIHEKSHIDSNNSPEGPN